MSCEEKYKRYLSRYARVYCNGDVKVAETHAIVKSYKASIEEDERVRLHKKR